MPKPRNKCKAGDLQSIRSSKVPIWNFGPLVKQSPAGPPLPPIPSLPPATKDQVNINTNTVKNLAAEPTPVSKLKIFNKICQAQKSQLQEFVVTENLENEYQEVAEKQTSNGCYVLSSAEGLPQEYFPPPPFAPGY